MQVPTGSTRKVSEGMIIFLIAAVQFINILEFMIVMPLGPDFAADLGIATSHLGIIGGSYTAAAAIAGLAGSFFLDRFDRRKAVAFCMLGLVIVTAGVGLAVNLETLVFARVLAGICGGPATSLAGAIIADTIPPERRGRAMGIVMGSFAAASVLGVPLGLELASIGGWRLPFFAISFIGLVIIGFVIAKLPPLRDHLDSPASLATQEAREGLLAMLKRPIVQVSYLMTSAVMMGMFLIIPNISAYVQNNLGYPRSRLSLLYLCGGIVSFFVMRLVGPLVDRYGAFHIGTLGTACMLVIIFVGFAHEPATAAVLPLFIALMAFSSTRNVPMQTLISQVPFPYERARFMSLNSSVQHFSTAAGAFLSSSLLREGAGGALIGMDTVSIIAMLLTACFPLFVYQLQRLLALRPVPESGW